jgi:hypothetical protein
MGWLSVLMGAAASVIFYGLAEMVWLTASASATIGGFWSWGVMHNYATDAAKRRPGFGGGFWDITQAEAASVPNWITMRSASDSRIRRGSRSGRRGGR